MFSFFKHFLGYKFPALSLMLHPPLAFSQSAGISPRALQSSGSMVAFCFVRNAETKVVHRLIVDFYFVLLLLNIILQGNKFQLPAKYIRFPLFEEAQFVGSLKS